MNRRELIRLAGAGAFAVATRAMPRSAHATEPRSRPRFYLHIIPSGGMDAIYGADPKTAREVDRGVDVPYAPKAIVTGKHSAVGPAFAALAPWLPRIAIVNAFRQNSANHQGGLVHITCCRSTAVTGTPTLFDVLGARRASTTAVGAITLGTAFAAAFSPKYLGQPTREQFGSQPGLFDHLDAITPHDLVEAAKALRREGKAAARTSAAETVTATNLLDSAALLDKWAASPKFAPAAWPLEGEPDAQNGRDIERALWLFEHDLARCVTIGVTGQEFDTHVVNSLQLGYCTYLARLLARLFEELDKRTFDGRSLAEQTIVMCGSEIGRFPRLNAANGKDHFPQVAYLFYGAPIAAGAAYGATDAHMVAKPVALATGAPDTSGHVLSVDDIGTTLVRLDGANPEVYGYAGAHLDFLVRG